MGISKTSDHIQIKIKMPNPSQEPQASPKAQNQDFKDMAVLCSFEIKIESRHSEHGLTTDQWSYPNQDQDAKPQSGTSIILQSPKWGLKGHGCSLHLQNQDREPKFGSWLYQRPVTIFKARSRCQTPVRNLQHPPKPQIKMESQNLEKGCIKHQWSFLNQDQDPKPQSGTSRILQNPKSGFKRRFSFHL